MRQEMGREGQDNKALLPRYKIWPSLASRLCAAATEFPAASSPSRVMLVESLRRTTKRVLALALA